MKKNGKKSQNGELSSTDLAIVATVLTTIADAIAVLAAVKAKEEEQQADTDF
ncbi:hypothetical protein M3231_04395 [Neobacillus mesonae]|nr:hypothetical protein [Neobacillus mesonae]